MSVSVEHVTLLLRSPDTISETVGDVSKADISTSGSAAAFAAMVAITSASPAIAGSVVGLSWEQDTLTIDVGAALPTFLPYNIGGIADVSADPGEIGLSGSDITLTIGSASAFSIPVDVASTSPSGQSIILEANNFFDSAFPSFSGGDVPLSVGAPVVRAQPSFAGQDIALTLSNHGVAEVVSSNISISGQDVALQQTWSTSVTKADISPLGSSVALEWTIDNGVKIVAAETALFGFGSSPVTLRISNSVGNAAPSISGSTITFLQGFSIPVFGESISLTPSEISLSYTFTLGIVPEPSNITFSGGTIVPFLGSGAPAKARVGQTSPHIEITLSAPNQFSQVSSGQIKSS